MNDYLQRERRDYRESRTDLQMHFIDGRMVSDELTFLPSPIRTYKATVYADEYMGETADSELLIKYYEEDKRVVVEIQNQDGCCFCWDSAVKDRNVYVMVYLLTENSEFLLYRSLKDFFCFLMRPKRDPHGNVTYKTANNQLITNYHVLDKLLLEKTSYYFKCFPEAWEV